MKVQAEKQEGSRPKVKENQKRMMATLVDSLAGCGKVFFFFSQTFSGAKAAKGADSLSDSLKESQHLGDKFENTLKPYLFFMCLSLIV